MTTESGNRQSDQSDDSQTAAATIRGLQKANSTLQQQLVEYRRLIENSDDLVVKVDPSGRFLFASPSYCKLFGRSEEELVGQRFMPLVHEDDRGATALAMSKLSAAPHQSYIEQRAMTVLGWRWLAWSDNALLGDDQEVCAIVGIGRDITAQKEMEFALRESELRYRELFENMGDGVAVYRANAEGSDFTFVEVNRAAEKILKVGRDGLIGRSVRQVFPGVEDFGLLSVFEDVWRSGNPRYHPARHYLDSRIEVWVDNYVLKLPNDEIVAIFEDLSSQKRAEQLLLESERRLRDSQAYAHVGYWELYPDKDRAVWSDEVYRISGLAPSVPPGRQTLQRIVHPDDLPKVLASLQMSLDTGREHHVEYRIKRPDGEERWVDCRARAVGDAPGHIKKLTGFLQDITERKAAEIALQASEERFELAMLGANDGLFDWDLEKQQIYYSSRWKSMLGYRDDELPNVIDSWQRLVDQAGRSDVLELLGKGAFGQRDKLEIEYQLRHKEGHWVDLLARAYVKKNPQGEPVRIVGTHVDISARKLAEKEIQYLAFHDSLTGLPNRLLFNQTLEQVCTNFLRDGKMFAIHLLDLDNFKEVNDSLGHPVGDELLKAVARRISETIRTSDLLARLGGDEFALIQHGVADSSEASILASKIIKAVGEVFQLESNAVHTGVSIGIALPERTRLDSARLVSFADVAMYKAKESGGSGYAFFEDRMTQQLHAEMDLCERLRTALRGNELFLLYQPQYRSDTGTLDGVEALLRWRQPDGEILQPNDFLPIAERRGLIKQISVFSLTESCRQARTWLDLGVEFRRIAVNLCASQVQSEDFAELVTSTVESFGLDPSMISFEFTETTLMESTVEMRDAVKCLADRGFQFAIDDFGSGFASFRYLRELPADQLKIGSEFVRFITEDKDDVAIVESIVRLGRSLGLKTIAEGVETEAQQQILAELGCELVQGYLHGAPMSAAEIQVLCESGSGSGKV